MDDTWHPRMLPPIWMVVAIASMFALNWWLSGPQLLGWPWRLLGIPVIALGAGIALWGERQFARAQTGVIPGSEITTFVRTGPYRRIRNPMYLGMTLSLVGVALLFGTATGLLVPPAFAAVIQTRFIRNEEAMLRERFGDDAWRDYASSTRRWI